MSRHAPPPSRPRGHLLTERRNPRTLRLDAGTPSTAFDLLQAEDTLVAAAVGRAKAPILRAVRLIEQAWRRGGRVLYVGAGTSGRMGVLDAAEWPPTFGVERRRIVGLIAGGRRATWRAVEGAEDDEKAAASDVARVKIRRGDVLFGIAAGGTTPYVHAALAVARRRGARTIFLACVPKTQAAANVDVDIRILTGPEPLTGSTRMKAGLATKMALNRISTLAMVRLGKVYENLMVDLDAYACRKLTDRATRIVALLTMRRYDDALALLRAARGRVKTALVMHHGAIGRAAAEALLDRHAGLVRPALAAAKSRSPHA